MLPSIPLQSEPQHSWDRIFQRGTWRDKRPDSPSNQMSIHQTPSRPWNDKSSPMTNPQDRNKQGKTAQTFQGSRTTLAGRQRAILCCFLASVPFFDSFPLQKCVVGYYQSKMSTASTQTAISVECTWCLWDQCANILYPVVRRSFLWFLSRFIFHLTQQQRTSIAVFVGWALTAVLKTSPPPINQTNPTTTTNEGGRDHHIYEILAILPWRQW